MARMLTNSPGARRSTATTSGFFFRTLAMNRRPYKTIAMACQRLRPLMKPSCTLRRRVLHAQIFLRGLDLVLHCGVFAVGFDGGELVFELGEAGLEDGGVFFGSAPGLLGVLEALRRLLHDAVGLGEPGVGLRQALRVGRDVRAGLRNGRFEVLKLDQPFELWGHLGSQFNRA